jgi:hypothetical protein
LPHLKISLSKAQCSHIATFHIYIYTWTSSDGETHSQIDHILVEKRRHSSVLDVRSLRAADCDADHCLVVAKITERLAVNKQGLHKFHMERFSLKKLNKVEGKEKYRVEVSTGLQHWKIWMLRLKR